MTGFTHNVKLATNQKEIKSMAKVTFDPEAFIQDKIYNQPVKYQVKTFVYCLTHHGYATIIKASDKENTYLCKLRLDSNEVGNSGESKDVTVSFEELTRQIKVQVRVAAT